MNNNLFVKEVYFIKMLCFKDTKNIYIYYNNHLLAEVSLILENSYEIYNTPKDVSESQIKILKTLVDIFSNTPIDQRNLASKF